jgi:hypothetical protein
MCACQGIPACFRQQILPGERDEPWNPAKIAQNRLVSACPGWSSAGAEIAPLASDMETIITSFMNSMPWQKTPPPVPAPAEGDSDDPAVLDAIIRANRATINKCWDELDRLTLVLQMLNAREAQLSARSRQAPGSDMSKLHTRVNLSRPASTFPSSAQNDSSAPGAKGA